MSIHPAVPDATPKHRGISYTTPINSAKEAVTVVELAGRLTGLRRAGKGWVGKCPLPDHPDRTPSFHVYPQTDSFFCYGCLRGGDVVTLARLAWGYDAHDAHVAAADLLHEFGHEIPPRPPSWFAKQERQKPIRDKAHEIRLKAAQRRLMGIHTPLLEGIEDPQERKDEALRIWDDCGRLARLAVGA